MGVTEYVDTSDMGRSRLDLVMCLRVDARRDLAGCEISGCRMQQAGIATTANPGLAWSLGLRNAMVALGVSEAA